MNSSEILRAIVKLVGLAVLISGIIEASVSLPIVYEAVVNMEVGTPAASFIGSFATPIIIGILMWLFPTPITNTIIKGDFVKSTHHEFLLGLESIGIRILGIYLLYHGIADLVSNSINYWYEREMLANGVQLFNTGNTKVGLIVTGIEILISILLIIGARKITTIIRKIKYAS